MVTVRLDANLKPILTLLGCPPNRYTLDVGSRTLKTTPQPFLSFQITSMRPKIGLRLLHPFGDSPSKPRLQAEEGRLTR